MLKFAYKSIYMHTYIHIFIDIIYTRIHKLHRPRSQEHGDGVIPAAPSRQERTWLVKRHPRYRRRDSGGQSSVQLGDR